MRVTAPNEAPDWAHQFAKNVQRAIDNTIWPYIRRSPIAVADLPDATLWAWQKFYVSDGTAGMTEVTSDGTSWRYPTGATA